MLNLQKVDDGVIFRVKVQPASGKNEIVGVQGDALKIKISAPPLKGKANKVLVDFLNALIPTPAYKDDCPDIGLCTNPSTEIRVW